MKEKITQFKRQANVWHEMKFLLSIHGDYIKTNENTKNARLKMSKKCIKVADIE